MQYWQRRRKRNEKDRQKLRMHLVCQAKCNYPCVIRFKDGKMGNQNARRLDVVQTEKIDLYYAFLYDLIDLQNNVTKNYKKIIAGGNANE